MKTTPAQLPLRRTVKRKPRKEIPSIRTGVDLSIALPLIIVHVLGLTLAPFTYSWTGLWLLFGVGYLTGFGVTAGVHRLFTHATFKASKPLEWILAILFLLSAQGSLSRWVRDHYIHHRFSDKEGDPHSPNHEEGFWHAQFYWLWKKPATREESKRLYETYTPTLKNRPWVRTLSSTRFLIVLHLSMIVFMYALGAFVEAGARADFLIQGWYTGLSFLVWGVFLRIIYTLHVTSLVNSAAHLWGYKSYSGKDHSRNNWWVALLSLGEGWHNNHHQRPAAANQGFHKWWELDVTFILLLVLGCLGLLKDLRVYRAKKDKIEIWFPSRKQGSKQ